MKEHEYFWSHFEEPSFVEIISQNVYGKTQTRQREEPDQRLAGLAAGTKTITNTREESDQDPHHIGYGAIPRSPTLTSLKTLTETREEPDQDISCQFYRSFRS